MKKHKQVRLEIYAKMWTNLATFLQFDDGLDIELRIVMVNYLMESYEK